MHLWAGAGNGCAFFIPPAPALNVCSIEDSPHFPPPRGISEGGSWAALPFASLTWGWPDILFFAWILAKLSQRCSINICWRDGGEGWCLYPPLGLTSCSDHCPRPSHTHLYPTRGRLKKLPATHRPLQRSKGDTYT